jgi:hypothetical protein
MGTHAQCFYITITVSTQSSLRTYQDSEDAPSLGLLITMHLDWLATFRVSDVAAGHMWSVLRSLIPSENVHPVVARTTFSRIKKFVDDHKIRCVSKTPICPCAKTIYHDFHDPELRDLFPFCNTRRKQCSSCGLSKYIPNTSLPRKVVYYLSPEDWLRDLYQRADIAAALDNSLDPKNFPKGSLRRSEGWRQKITDNPMMNCDRRHAPLVGMADGAPYFKDRNAGSGWFFLLRHAGLPEELLVDQTLAHMTLFISSEHYEVGKKGKLLRKRRYVHCLTLSSVSYTPNVPNSRHVLTNVRNF